MSLEYGIIGNCKTSALVGPNASIDWLCFPRFDSPSIFSKVLDVRKGGSFSIKPVGKYSVHQEYVKDTNVIRTLFSKGKDSFEVIDFFPHYKQEDGSLFKESEIYRIIRVLSGKPTVRIILQPRFEYGLHKGKAGDLNGFLRYSGPKESLYVYTNLDKSLVKSGKPITLQHFSYIAISYNMVKEDINVIAVKKRLEATIRYWRGWLKDVVLPKKYRDLVARSALVLRLLTYDETGAIVAAATTSIPEIIGDVRNWDYRYCWIRDASFTVMALIKLGKFDVAYEFMGWLRSIYSKHGVSAQILFGVDGSRNIEERILKHLSGYKNSKPVRIGNAAYNQSQLDVFGDALDTLHMFYLKYKAAPIIDEVEWNIIRSLVEYARIEWKGPDRSIWEFRTKSMHFTFSKVLCWVALDRGAKLAMQYGKMDIANKWEKEADEIRNDVLDKGWNEEMGTFTQAYGSKNLDASVLLMPYFGFLPYSDPRIRSTVKVLKKELFDGKFIMRYNGADDFGKQKSAFLACTFWLIDALNGIGEVEEAKKIFDNAVGYTNRFGLLSEDLNRKTGELLGNFPQAYSHIALINTAMDLYK